MCGILVSLHQGDEQLPAEHALTLLKARGPDSFCTTSARLSPGLAHENVPLSTQFYSLICCSSVLALRGDFIQHQPLADQATGSILCWNGEAWKLDSNVVSGNDSSLVFQALLSAASSPSPTNATIEVLTSITGPFAFVFFDARSSTVYYGRDRLGRRSLVLQKDESGLCICSVPSVQDLPSVEVDPCCVYTLTISEDQIKTTRLPWSSPTPSTNRALPDATIASSPQVQAVDQLLCRLSASLELRVQNVPNHAGIHLSGGSARIAVLFSGGLDCTLLARITHDLLPIDQSIDLLNVAFENPRVMKAHNDPELSPYEICPDRRTGRASFAELVQVCPNRKWRFVAVNVPYTETLEHKTAIIELMKPHNTEMDLSIATALYFAARGIGLAYSASDPAFQAQAYTTTARVLLSGLGADELFGGYSRHAAAFDRDGFGGLAAELDLDYQRIGQRNLGRDDRVISCWSKETRYPFLDEDFVKFALDLPVWEKCGFRPEKRTPKHSEEPLDVNDPLELDPAKMILRLAAWRLGMNKVAAEKKRAIQFGARTAKMEAGGGRKRGTDAL